MSEKTSRFYVVLGAFLVMVAYLPGLTGALYYDDYSNLEGLSGIADLQSAVRFVFDGHAGPLGRPIALATFLPMYMGWPENAYLGLSFNLLIHVVNFFLLFFLGKLILVRATGLRVSEVYWVALGAAFLWAVLPILISSSLILIQRMTGLSALFGLMGLVGFVYGYNWADRYALKGVFFQLSVLGAGTLFSVLSKENGALFPVYALVLDCLFKGFQTNYGWVRRLVLLALLTAVLYQLSPFNIAYFEVDSFRGFSPVDRLITEVVILWEYVFRAFLPLKPTAFGPFHDYYGIRSLDWVVYIASFSWMLVLGFGFYLRKSAPLLLFSVLWFLAGHLVESTTVLLELYFEHRNYVALWGCCLFLGWVGVRFYLRFGRLAIFTVMAYLCLMWMVTISITLLWGNQSLAAETWAAKHPGSARAALHAVFIELGKDSVGGSYETHVNYMGREKQDYALRVLNRTMVACPDCVDVRMRALIFACSLGRSEEQRNLYEDIYRLAPSGSVTSSVVSLSFDLVAAVSAGGCAEVSARELERLFSQIRSNAFLKFPLFSAKLYFSEAMLAESQGDWEAVKRILKQAAEESPAAIPIVQYQVYAAINSDDLEYGLAALEYRMKVLSFSERNQLKSVLFDLQSQLGRTE